MHMNTLIREIHNTNISQSKMLRELEMKLRNRLTDYEYDLTVQVKKTEVVLFAKGVVLPSEVVDEISNDFLLKLDMRMIMYNADGTICGSSYFFKYG